MKPALLFVGLLFSSVFAFANAEQDTAGVPADYPLNTCVVSGEELGSMGKPVEYVVKTEGKPDRTIYLCCKMCIGKVKKDPEKYLKKLDEAAAAKK